MTMEMKGTIHEVAEKEVEALAAGKQTQDFPQDLQSNDIKCTAINQKESKPTPSNDAVDENKAPTPTPAPAPVPAGQKLARKTREFPELLPAWSGPVDIGDLADDMATLIKRHCVLKDEEVDATVLWIISSYLINGFGIFPKLSLISPEKRCGKSTTMEVISAMAKDGLLTSNVSAAVMYRLTEQYELTLFIDEADTFLKNGNPELVGLINSSHNKNSSNILRCTGDDHTPRAYSTWMPMVLASIGELPPTIMDRSIVINLRRMAASECVDRVPGNLLAACQPIRRKLLSWCEAHFEIIESNPVEPPKIGNDRAADNWLPLFTVAGKIGNSWPTRCGAAYSALTTTAELELPTQLLCDIRDVLRRLGDMRISSEDLVSELCMDTTGPWQTSSNGKNLTQHQMARLLNPYGIKPKNVRYGDRTKRSYEKGQFADAFERYL